VAHLVWSSPIATLVVAIQAYSFDPMLEEAARDLGASTWQILRELTIPLLMPGVLAAGLFAFLLSWGNFPLSLYTTGADSTLPEWLYAKMVSGYSPQVPALGIIAIASSAAIVLIAVLISSLFRAFRAGRAG
jgi:spermidine/putrescine transport system permease protein